MLQYFTHLRHKKGFTLIELLIVVAIIGILAAIAIPNLISAQRRSRYSRAAGESKQIVTFAQTMTSDNNQTPGQLFTAGLLSGMPFGLWDGTAPAKTVYMAAAQDPWGKVVGTRCLAGLDTQCYGYGEAACAGGILGPGCVTYGAHSVGGDATEQNAGWAGAVVIAAGSDDLGYSSLVGCAFDNVTVPNPTGIANPC